MASVVEDVEVAESIAIILAIAIGAYFIYDAFKNSNNAFWVGVRNLFAVPTGSLADFASGKVASLTAAQAQSIATQFGHGSDYQLSPDSSQVWFPNGSYFDAPTGHVFQKDGADAGPAFSGSGATTGNVVTGYSVNMGVNQAAYNAVNPSCWASSIASQAFPGVGSC